MYLVDGIPENGFLGGQPIPETAFFRHGGLTFHRQGDAHFRKGFIDRAKRAFRPGEADVGGALVEGLLDFHGAEADAQRRCGLGLHVVERPGCRKDDQGDQHSLTVVQRAAVGDFAIKQPLLDGNEIGVGLCRRGLLLAEKFLSVLFRRLKTLHGISLLVPFRRRKGVMHGGR